MPAILEARSETSKAVTARMPDWPAMSFSQLGFTPQASGVAMPMPVTTTRRINSPAGRIEGKYQDRRGNCPPDQDLLSM
jgi:hypothetical protein